MSEQLCILRWESSKLHNEGEQIMVKIGMDYGHGGSDPGAVYNGRRESDDVLRLGLLMAGKLRAAGLAVEESRTGDTAVSLGQRSRMSNERSDTHFLSIHRNAFRPETATGAEVFVHSSAGEEAVKLAEGIQAALVKVGYVDRGVKRANFFVLRETRAPAVLLEIGFIDNTQDNNLFDSKFEGIADEVVDAVLTYLGHTKTDAAVPSLHDDLQVLVQHGLLQSPTYWEQNARSGGSVRGEYAAALIRRIADHLRRGE